MALGIVWMGKRRPPGTPLTWGEAMVASVYCFFLLFWIYGVVPHLWLAWADNELRWRPDKLLFGPGELATFVAQLDVPHLDQIQMPVEQRVEIVNRQVERVTSHS